MLHVASRYYEVYINVDILLYLASRDEEVHEHVGRGGATKLGSCRSCVTNQQYSLGG